MLEAMPGVGNILRGKVWVMASKVADANASIQRAHNHMRISQTTIFEASQGAWPECPTHFVTNKYTVAFQEFVNTYGIPGYKEINPALFTAATFPFLFGMMYGDVGHGTILMLAGLYLILTEKKAEDRKTPEMVKSMYMGRYMLFAMGCCGIYAGLLYNDFFSLGMNLFGSSWTYTQENGVPAKNIGPYGDEDAVYPFGADPAWKISSNELLFFNSMKMKMSVIVGITQMIFGICLRGMNSRYFKSSLDFYCEFVPMILFATSFFGYMIVLIFIKWSIDWNYRMGLGSCAYDINGSLGACSLSSSNKSCYTVGGKECNADTTVADMCPLDYGGTGDGCQPPNLITTLINIVLSPGNVVEPMFANQGSLQSTLLSIAFICVPWLLLVKPLYLKRQHDKRSEYHIIEDEQQSNPLIDSDGLPPSVFDAEPSPGGDGHGHGHGKAFNFSEIFIHQTIETIEFVLGMVSNTASYLRLWALSLAHTELAAVFWEKTMLTTINTENPFYIFMGFYVFAGVTTGVLLCMDVLECFLHALRLHWVEFQNKFYKASGYKFEPYDFKAIMDKCTFD
jgi:V-type H+-transporting ATPase subunit a